MYIEGDEGIVIRQHNNTFPLCVARSVSVGGEGGILLNSGVVDFRSQLRYCSRDHILFEILQLFFGGRLGNPPEFASFVRSLYIYV